MDHIDEAELVDTGFIMEMLKKAHKHTQLVSMVNFMNDMAGFGMVDVPAQQFTSAFTVSGSTPVSLFLARMILASMSIR